MKYITDGKLIDKIHSDEIATGNDGINWNFFLKEKVKEVTSYGMAIRINFTDGSFLDLHMQDIQNQPTWTSNGLDGVAAAKNDISTWLETRATAMAIDLRNYVTGWKGFNAITPAQGLLNGNWYLVRTLDDTVFGVLTEFGSNLVNTWTIPAGFTFPEKEMLTTADLDGSGFTQIQITSGKVIAYKK